MIYCKRNSSIHSPAWESGFGLISSFWVGWANQIMRYPAELIGPSLHKLALIHPPPACAGCSANALHWLPRGPKTTCRSSWHQHDPLNLVDTLQYHINLSHAWIFCFHCHLCFIVTFVWVLCLEKPKSISHGSISSTGMQSWRFLVVRNSLPVLKNKALCT